MGKKNRNTFLELSPFNFFQYFLGADQHLLKRYCSTATPPPLTSSGYIATVHFHSDDSLSDTGFSIAWSAVPGLFSNCLETYACIMSYLKC